MCVIILKLDNHARHWGTAHQHCRNRTSFHFNIEALRVDYITFSGDGLGHNIPAGSKIRNHNLTIDIGQESPNHSPVNLCNLKLRIHNRDIPVQFIHIFNAQGVTLFRLKSDMNRDIASFHFYSLFFQNDSVAILDNSLFNHIKSWSQCRRLHCTCGICGQCVNQFAILDPNFKSRTRQRIFGILVDTVNDDAGLRHIEECHMGNFTHFHISDDRFSFHDIALGRFNFLHQIPSRFQVIDQNQTINIGYTFRNHLVVCQSCNFEAGIGKGFFGQCIHLFNQQ